MAKVFPVEQPFCSTEYVRLQERGVWPAYWIDAPERSTDCPTVMLFRRKFVIDKATTVRIHVSADNRYRLMLDGMPVGRGPERGDPRHWRYESYDLDLAPGEHTFIAMTWWLGKLAPFAQMSVRPGFLLAAEGDLQQTLSTGIAEWECSSVDGMSFEPPANISSYIAGAKLVVDGTVFPWGWETGNVGIWQPAMRITKAVTTAIEYDIQPYWVLTASTLPAMLEVPRASGVVRFLTDLLVSHPVNMQAHLADEALQWQQWIAGNEAIDIPAHTTRTAVIDLENYCCVFPVLRVSGGQGTVVRLDWSESLLVETNGWNKGNRDEIDGKYFVGAGEEFHPDGGMNREFTSLWWEAGRYLKVSIITGDEPVSLESLTLLETRYPLEMSGTFRCADYRVENIIPLAVRTLQMCAHENYMDCPYYEQLMYVGDTRLEVLTTYTMMPDDRLPRKAIQTFNDSRGDSGLTQSRFPSLVTQFIPPFSLWWVGMVHDYWLWRNDPAFVRAQMPGVRSVMEYFRTLLRDDGLINPPHGWNFVDWVHGWHDGVPQDGQDAPSAIINLQCALSLIAKADLEDYFGEPQLAARDRETAVRMSEAVFQQFWSDEHGLLADDLGFTHFSEHAQCLALLTGLVPHDYREKLVSGLLTDPNLARTTIYFTHYLFETLYQLGQADSIRKRLDLWCNLPDRGFFTLLESPEPNRSDCHAWGAHPLYHFYASFLGIRPAGAGFQQVRIAPQLGSLSWIEGTMPHPAGNISVALHRENGMLHAEISLPEEVTGTFVWGECESALAAGKTELLLSDPYLASV
ncbi:MAG TPA: alpha-L-rhamnosidase C-terminal domain-containing protein [Armatimonadota bacterium]|nr:alpha-L-rhamnosidase C-terminal domain-containing protein [Armatimonadota bacterium]